MSFYLGVLFAILASILWGVNSHILRAGASGENPFMALLYRGIVAFPILLIMTLVFRPLSALTVYLSSELILWVLLLVLSIIIGDGIYIYAMKKYEVSIILPVATSYPVLVSVILIAFGIEHLGGLILIGTLMVVLGIALVTHYRYNTDNIRTGIEPEAILLGLGVALGWGMSVVFARIILDAADTESFGLMTIRTVVIGLVGGMIYFSNSNNRQEYRKKSIATKKRSFSIFGLSGIFGWVLGATLLFLALENIEAGIATPISASNPIIAVIIGQFTGIDKINFKQFLGILLTTLGVILIVI